MPPPAPCTAVPARTGQRTGATEALKSRRIRRHHLGIIVGEEGVAPGKSSAAYIQAATQGDTTVAAVAAISGRSNGHGSTVRGHDGTASAGPPLSTGATGGYVGREWG